MVKTKQEILEAIKDRFGEKPEDEVIALLEDVTDTLTDLETRANGDSEDWKTKYEENDKEWRRKYTERFFSPDDGSKPEPEPEHEPKKPNRFEDLFIVEEN